MNRAENNSITHDEKTAYFELLVKLGFFKKQILKNGKVYYKRTTKQ